MEELDEPNGEDSTLYEKNLRDLGLLFLYITANNQMPMSVREFAKQKSEIARVISLDESRLTELF